MKTKKINSMESYYKQLGDDINEVDKYDKDYSEILNECSILARERQQQYGKAQHSITLMSMILSETFGIKLTPKECCLVMVALKLSREKFNKKEDNIKDSINYLAIYLSL